MRPADIVPLALIISIVFRIPPVGMIEVAILPSAARTISTIVAFSRFLVLVFDEVMCIATGRDSIQAKPVHGERSGFGGKFRARERCRS